MIPGARSTRAQQHPHSPGAQRKSPRRPPTAILEFSPLILPISSTCSRASPKHTRRTEWTCPSPKQFGLPSSLHHHQNDHSHPSDLLPLSLLRVAANPSVPPLSDSRSSLLIFSRRFEHILFKLWICFCNTHTFVQRSGQTRNECGQVSSLGSSRGNLCVTNCVCPPDTNGNV